MTQEPFYTCIRNEEEIQALFNYLEKYRPEIAQDYRVPSTLHRMRTSVKNGRIFVRVGTSPRFIDMPLGFNQSPITYNTKKLKFIDFSAFSELLKTNETSKECKCDVWAGGCTCGAVTPYSLKWE
jgi:hypothetical protein